MLGQAMSQALGDKAGIVRYGCAHLPMDETLSRVAVDLSGRAFLEYRAPAGVDASAAFSFQLVEEFLRGFAHNVARQRPRRNPLRPRQPPHGRVHLQRPRPRTRPGHPHRPARHRRAQHQRRALTQGTSLALRQAMRIGLIDYGGRQSAERPQCRLRSLGLESRLVADAARSRGRWSTLIFPGVGRLRRFACVICASGDSAIRCASGSRRTAVLRHLHRLSGPLRVERGDRLASRARSLSGHGRGDARRPG